MLGFLLLGAFHSTESTSRSLNGRTCSLTCDSACARCTEKTIVNGGVNVKIDLSGCKGGESMSWMCCRNSGCNILDCDGEKSMPAKCDEVTWATYFVPDGEDRVLVQIHDGAMAGNMTCSSGTCCGGAGTSCNNGVSGVCNQYVELSSCPNGENFGGGGGSGCTFDEDCPASYDCATGVCVNGQCTVTAVTDSRVCRASSGPCDVAETCDGVSFDCPEDRLSASGVVCRAANGICDREEVCNGTSTECPMDAFKGVETVCRSVNGVCDVEETCNGTSAACPQDVFMGSDVVCRASDGACDKEELCTGVSVDCPENAYWGTETVCREAVYSVDGTTCDVEERCSGNSVDCPADSFKSVGSVCRESQDKCDVVDSCAGGRDCPEDLRKDTGYTYKCGTTCFLCSVKPSELELVSKNSFKLDGCGTGSCGTFVHLDWPSCMNKCIAGLCPNNRGLSNAIFATCERDTGAWNCTKKVEVSSVMQFPICG
jgi:hypothetical protein